MRIWPLSCAGLLIVLLSACANVQEHLQPAELQAFERQGEFVSEWERVLGVGQDERYARLQPTLVDGILYVADVNGTVAAVNAENGRRLWRTRLRNEAGRSFLGITWGNNVEIGGAVGVGGDLVLVGTLDGYVIALDKESGEEQWRSRVSTEVVSAPQSNGQVVIALAIDGRVFALDPATGERRWSYDHAAPLLSLRTNAAPVFVGNNVFIAFDNGQLLSFSANDGALRWSVRVGQPRGTTELERLVDLNSTPVNAGPYLYAAGYNSRLVALSRGSGRVNWSQDLSTFQNISVSGGKVIVVDTNSHVHAYDALSGAQAWVNTDLHRRNLSAPAVVGETVVVADFRGFVHGLSLQTGELIARARPWQEGQVLAQPVTAEDRVFLYNDQGVLLAYSVRMFDEDYQPPGDLPRHRGAIPTRPTGFIRSR